MSIGCATQDGTGKGLPCKQPRVRAAGSPKPDVVRYLLSQSALRHRNPICELSWFVLNLVQSLVRADLRTNNIWLALGRVSEQSALVMGPASRKELYTTPRLGEIGRIRLNKPHRSWTTPEGAGSRC